MAAAHRGPLTPLAYNFICAVEQADGSEAILKLGVPSPELKSESAALKRFAGRSYAKLLRQYPEAGATLLERLRPGENVLSLGQDEAQTLIVAQQMRKTPVIDSGLEEFTEVSNWGQGFWRVRELVGEPGLPAGAKLFKRAERLYQELCDSAEEKVLLHGDLHHWNLLSSGARQWKAIDPKCVVGERVYEIGAWMRNPVHPMDRHTAQPLIRRRIDIFADQLGFDRERMQGWAFSQCVLAACWSLEEKDKSRDWFAEWARELNETFYPKQL